MKKYILLFLLIPMLVSAEWIRIEVDEDNIRQGFPDFHSELYYHTEYHSLCLVDKESETFEEHRLQLIVFINYLFFMHPDYSESSLDGILVCYDNAGVLQFEHWIKYEKMLRLNELDNWPEVLNYFYREEWKNFLKVNNIA